MNRCKHKHPKNKYIERGITVSKDWQTFENFFRDMAGSFKEGLTLERINNDEGYSKENCRWATMKEQAQNRSSSLRINYDGGIYSLSQLADKYSIPYPVLFSRIDNNGWEIQRALNTPVMSKEQVGKYSVKSPNHINHKKWKK